MMRMKIAQDITGGAAQLESGNAQKQLGLKLKKRPRTSQNYTATRGQLKK